MKYPLVIQRPIPRQLHLELHDLRQSFYRKNLFVFQHVFQLWYFLTLNIYICFTGRGFQFAGCNKLPQFVIPINGVVPFNIPIPGA